MQSILFSLVSRAPEGLPHLQTPLGAGVCAVSALRMAGWVRVLWVWGCGRRWLVGRGWPMPIARRQIRPRSRGRRRWPVMRVAVHRRPQTVVERGGLRLRRLAGRPVRLRRHRWV